MCTFEGDRAVVVCDVAIARVRQEAAAAFGQVVQYTVVNGQGTRVQVPTTVDLEEFATRMRAAIAAAQTRDANASVLGPP